MDGSNVTPNAKGNKKVVRECGCDCFLKCFLFINILFYFFKFFLILIYKNDLKTLKIFSKKAEKMTFHHGKKYERTK